MTTPINDRGGIPEQSNSVGATESRSEEGLSTQDLLENEKERRAARLQFPRRLILLLLALGAALALLVGIRGLFPIPGMPPGSDWSVSWSARRPVLDLVREHLPNSLLLLGETLVFALVLSLIGLSLSVWLRSLTKGWGQPGTFLGGLARLAAYALVSAPPIVLVMFVLYLLAFRLRWIPVVIRVNSPALLGELVLPAAILALLPAFLASRAAFRKVVWRREGDHASRRGIFTLLSVVFGLTGGILSGMVLLELIFAYPGIGRLAVQSVLQRDYPTVFGVLAAFVVLSFAGQVLAELFRWLERLSAAPVLRAGESAASERTGAQTAWIVLALLLLLIPLALVMGAAVTGPEGALRQDLQERDAPPSSEHLLGTDRLGRDLAARLMWGGLVTLRIAALVAIAALALGVMAGIPAGLLASRGGLGAETASDLLLWPADVLLLYPAVPGALLVVLMSGQMGWVWVALATTIVLAPRAMRACRSLMLAQHAARGAGAWVLAGFGVLFMALWASFILVAAVEFLGLGVMPPTPSLGSMLGEGMRMLRPNPGQALIPAAIIWVCGFAFLMAGIAFTRHSGDRETLARLSE